MSHIPPSSSSKPAISTSDLQVNHTESQKKKKVILNKEKSKVMVETVQSANPPKSQPQNASSKLSEKKIKSLTPQKNEKSCNPDHYVNDTESQKKKKVIVNEEKSKVRVETVQSANPPKSQPQGVSSKLSEKKIKSVTPQKNEKSCNPDHYYMDYILQSTDVGREVFGIPIRLLTPPMRKSLGVDSMKFSEKSANVNMSPNERMKLWKSLYPDLRVYEVISLKPQRIRGNGESIRFFDRYDQPLYQGFEVGNISVNKEPQKNPGNPFLQVQSKLGTDILIMQKGSETLHDVISRPPEESQEELQALVRASQIIEKVKSNLTSVINQLQLNLSPSEPVMLIWAMLTQLVINKFIKNLELKHALELELISYWDKVYVLMSYCLFYGSCGNGNAQSSAEDFYDLAKDYLQRLKELLSLNTIKEKYQLDKHFISCLESINRSLADLLEEFLTLKPNECLELCIQLEVFFEKRLDDWCHCKVNLGNTKKSLKEWLQTRIEMLDLHIQLQEVPGCDDVVKTIKEALEGENWNIVYETICELVNKLEELKMQRTKNLIPVTKQSATNYFFSKRTLTFGRALFSDFKQILLDGKFIQPISGSACEQLRQTFSIVFQPFPSKEAFLSEFKFWYSSLPNPTKTQLKEAFDQLLLSWSTLKTLREDLMKRKELSNEIQSLLTFADNDQFEPLSDAYLKVAQELHPTLDSWENALRTYNLNIRRFQDFCILTLLDPTTPPIDIKIIKAQFIHLNSRIEDLIKPVTSFLNAFQQLISLDSDQVKKNINTTAANFFRISSFETLSLNFLQTDSSYFKDLEEQLNNLKAHQTNQGLVLEIEELDESISAIPVETANNSHSQIPVKIEKSSKSLQEEVAHIFGQTKRRKIENGLIQLFKEYNLSITKKFGKGDHLKLYINKIPIILPRHEEWKPGTLKNIQNEVLTVLRDLVKKDIN